MIVELRQYTLYPGQRDVLIDIFDREFVETQEEVGIRVIGQFRDTAAPDRFVWLRGFPDMDARLEALTAFYGGSQAWAEHGKAASATMIDSDDVLLLRPLGAGFAEPDGPRTDTPPESVVVATIVHRDAPVDDEFREFYAAEVLPALRAADAEPIACFETEYAPNTFTRLPVREGEHVLVWLSRFQDREHAEESLRRQEDTLPALPRTQRLVLSPTARSMLR